MVPRTILPWRSMPQAPSTAKVSAATGRAVTHLGCAQEVLGG